MCVQIINKCKSNIFVERDITFKQLKNAFHYHYLCRYSKIVKLLRLLQYIVIIITYRHKLHSKTEK